MLEWRVASGYCCVCGGPHSPYYPTISGNTQKQNTKLLFSVSAFVVLASFMCVCGGSERVVQPPKLRWAYEHRCALSCPVFDTSTAVHTQYGSWCRPYKSETAEGSSHVARDGRNTGGWKSGAGLLYPTHVAVVVPNCSVGDSRCRFPRPKKAQKSGGGGVWHICLQYKSYLQRFTESCTTGASSTSQPGVNNSYDTSAVCSLNLQYKTGFKRSQHSSFARRRGPASWKVPRKHETEERPRPSLPTKRQQQSRPQFLFCFLCCPTAARNIARYLPTTAFQKRGCQGG